ncbi:hypothetical protein M231_05831 [Tremella mesenterica]|uniref:tRNA dimethylallyltransferase n=1 Tax=Tremella mesenterica TaxID=5217 RepID=A0A4Q1BH62_TREME|nr:hypothetical protein M231_05831 [Tremella mesenterica]
MNSSRLRDIVAVIGTTGSGKSQLAVSLARSLDTLPSYVASPTELTRELTLLSVDEPGPSKPRQDLLRNGDVQFTTDQSEVSTRTIPTKAVVLSADSMQLYRGLDVITNKASVEEQCGVEHWGMNMVSPGEPSWELGRWCLEAGTKIDSLENSTLPIICGGTHYFIQHFLFPPSELSIVRPPTGSLKGKDKWTPPCPRPSTSGLGEEWEMLLNTFWTNQPIWPKSVISREETVSQYQSPPLSDKNSADLQIKKSATGLFDGEKGTAESSNQGHEQETQRRGASRTTLREAHLLALHQLLQAVDPKEAGRWHWRDGRKVRRGLERWWERGGSCAIEMMSRDESTSAARHGEENGLGNAFVEKRHLDEINKLGRRAKFRTLIFWVYEGMDTLGPKLDKRVDKMLENGLLKEIAEMREIATRIYGSSEQVDYTEGIFQSIGFKEFSSLPLDITNINAARSDPHFSTMLNRMKLATQQYARSQLKWIRKQLLPAVGEARELGGEVWVYVIPGGEEGEKVARDILSCFLRDEDMPDPKTIGHSQAVELLQVLEESGMKVPDTAERQIVNARKECPLCSETGRPFSVLAKEWRKHLSSRVHRRNIRLSRSKEEKASRVAQAKAKGIALAELRRDLRSSLSLDSDPSDALAISVIEMSISQVEKH